jgi:hypothetical protein
MKGIVLVPLEACDRVHLASVTFTEPEIDGDRQAHWNLSTIDSMKRFGSAAHAQRFLSGSGIIASWFRAKPRSLTDQQSRGEMNRLIHLG